MTTKFFISAHDAQTRCNVQEVDATIIGGGPAGSQCAIYAASEGLRVALIECNRIGGQIGQTTLLENVLGHPNGITGEQLRQGIKQQILKWNTDLSSHKGYDVSMIVAGEVVGIQSQGTKHVTTVVDSITEEECEIVSKSIVIASGMTWDSAKFDYSAMSPYHFHYGPEKIKTLAEYGNKFLVIGGGNSACQAALAGADEAHVDLIVRSDLNISEYLSPRMKANPTLNIHKPMEVRHVEMLNDTLYRAYLKSNLDDSVTTIDFNHMFYVANSKPNSDYLKGSGVGLSMDGLVITESNGVTTDVPGVFAIGDIVHGATRRVATAIGSGSTVVPFLHKRIDQTKDCGLEVSA